MVTVYGVAPSELISSGKRLVEFPPFTGRAVGGVVPVDCKVGVVELAPSALASTSDWGWKPADRGYLISVINVPFSVLKNHLRQIRHLEDEQGRRQLWPWFDPRYLKLALSALEGGDLANIFGPVQAYGFAVENAVEWYQLQAGELTIKQVSA